VSRDAVSRALAIAQVPRRRFSEFLKAYRAGGIDAVRQLDDGRRVADALTLEQRYRGAGVKLDTRTQHRREVGEET
jgi:hypothetical protein